ncbi:MAG: helix-turn-helix protein [Sphingomonadales bacterium]|nr:helix-turn-helix protein [Sphingomonadales bacterium]
MIEIKASAGDEPRVILVLVSDNFTLTDISGPADVFGIASQYFLPASGRPYDFVIASVRGGLVRTSSGLLFETRSLSEIPIETVDTVMVPGNGPPEDPPIPEDLVAWLMVHGAKAPRLCSLCTGGFILAAAGLLDGVRVTTHWRSAPIMAARYPAVNLDARPIFIQDGHIWSSAGMTACLDLALGMLEEDHGSEIAMEVARSMVLFLRRPGEQPQFSSALSTQGSGDPTFMRLHAWMMQNLANDLRLEVLADYAGMTPRTFTRRYARKIGRSAAKTVEVFRIEAAQRMLLQSEASLKHVARMCGFGDEQNLRRAFQRSVGILPEQFRQTSRMKEDDALPTRAASPNPLYA